MGHSSRYLIGIDLGTTNSVLAYVDTEQPEGNVPSTKLLDVPQLVGIGELRSWPVLPSFLYFPTQDELQGEGLSLPWERNPQCVAGMIAREHGALVPTRQVMSAKSWLSHGGVDRRASILPREAQPPLISPIDASAHYLLHLRNAWNDSPPAGAADAARLEAQEIVLTVPASFDEEARELTMEAARRAGLENVILLEEPLAAFYAWVSSHQARLQEELNDGDLVLICDVGGGTSDFSLVRAQVGSGDVQFEREAIGEHLLLGGDNLDIALARVVEKRLNARLGLRQRHGLQRACCAAKERLLSDPQLQSVPITVLGGGRAVVGQTVTSELLRDDVLDLLTRGFLPLSSVDEMPKRSSSAGLRELGLPYAADPAITKHLGAFLMEAGVSMGRTQRARPDAVLFNGGFCEPAVVRERIVDAIAGWFTAGDHERRPRILRNERFGSAVAMGAAHYGRVRRGWSGRIRAGSARSYYIGLRSDEGLRGVCVLPEGTEEGTTLPPAGREFAALANRPVSFALLSSRTRHDANGEVVQLDPDEVHRHAPLVTVLRYGKKMREQELSVRLRATFTEVGTLELWCESVGSPHRWRLQFELRGASPTLPAESKDAKPKPRESSPASAVSSQALGAASVVIRSVFGKSEAVDPQEPDTLVATLETTLATKKEAWPTALLRELGDRVLENPEGRNKSPRHEARWLNLLGYCLRPGFGFPGDEKRVAQVRSLFINGGKTARDLQSEVQWLVLLRRVSGGLNASQQHELYRKVLPSIEYGKKKRPRTNAQVEYDSWRLLASLEHLPANLRLPLGDEIAARIVEDKKWLWALGRFGARIPLYGPLSCVVPPEKASEWLSALLQLPMSPETVQAVGEVARYTGDSSRDVPSESRNAAVRALRAAAGPEMIERLRSFVPPERRDAVKAFGEPLPNDLHVVSSARCLLSMTALTPEPGRAA